MRPFLVGLDTEYGLQVGLDGPDRQIQSATELVSRCPVPSFAGWDAGGESPRSDLRGFVATSLSRDPQDARFDEGYEPSAPSAARADRVLTNGARFYNDHGHPEYATPECSSLDELILHDRAGDLAVVQAALAFQEASGKEARIYKNNTDFHGASYGCHENYLASRSVSFADLYHGIVPLLVARQVLCGAGKVGSEDGPRCDFQMSQRADFLTTTASVDTLYRRPLFNTRDEPHADPEQWVRLHVICGDANMSPTALRIKCGLVKIALGLIESGRAPTWDLTDPVKAFKAVSRAVESEGSIELTGRKATTPRAVIESYLDAYGLMADSKEDELLDVSTLCRTLLEARFSRPTEFAQYVDWATKRRVIREFLLDEGLDWTSAIAQSLDLEYSRLDGEGGLYTYLAENGMVSEQPAPLDVANRLRAPSEENRAFARSLAVTRFADHVKSVNWQSLTLETENGTKRLPLLPDRTYPKTLLNVSSVEEFIMAIEAINDGR